MKVLIDDRGYFSSVSDLGIELPTGATEATGFRYRRVDNAWVDIFPDVSDADVGQAYADLSASWGVANIKANVVDAIKQEAKRQIEASTWKIERATEADAVNGTTTLATVYAERAAIRAASNAAEAEVAALVTEADVMSYRISF